jgi:hypothetical protein
MSILRSQLSQVSRKPQRLDRHASSLFDPVRDRWIMHNSTFKGHPISSESEGTGRELMARAVLTMLHWFNCDGGVRVGGWQHCSFSLTVGLHSLAAPGVEWLEVNSNLWLLLAFHLPDTESISSRHVRVALRCGASQFPTPVEADSVRRAGAAGYAERSSPWEEKRVRGARLMKQGKRH